MHSAPTSPSSKTNRMDGKSVNSSAQKLTPLVVEAEEGPSTTATTAPTTNKSAARPLSASASVSITSPASLPPSPSEQRHMRKASHKSITIGSQGSLATDEHIHIHEHLLDRSDRSLTSVSLLSVSTTATSRPKPRRPSTTKRSSKAVQSSANSIASNSSFAFPPPILVPQHLQASKTISSNNSVSTYSYSHVNAYGHVNGNGNTDLYATSDNTSIIAKDDTASDLTSINPTISIGAAATATSESNFNFNTICSNHDLSSSTTSSFHYPQQHQKPKPRRPTSSCTLLCVFYAEFDNIVGPKICYQSPQKFMDSNIEITMEEIDEILEDTFGRHRGGIEKSNDDNDDIGDSNDCENDENCDNISISTPNEGEKFDEMSLKDVIDHHHVKSPGSQQQPQETSYSIFDSTSEYIVTSHEILTGKIISISTHNMHIISFPLIIQNTKKYDRTSFLFSVGFVIRRSSDPSPFRPLLSKLASTFQSMELESAFLSSEQSRSRLQDILDGVLLSLNSPSSECHMLLDDANILHLQYFPPPKVRGPPIPDYVVPVLLKHESELQSLDWDLTINWIVPHINGIEYVKHIAESSKVDPEMVRAALRVLRQYHVVACVDIFRYDNIYECTEKAQRMLAGDEDLEGLLDDAYNFVLRQSPSHPTQDGHVSGSSTRGSNSLGGGSNTPTSIHVNGGGGVGMSHQNSPHLSSFGGHNGPLNNSPSLGHYGSPGAYSPSNTPLTPTLIHPQLSSSTNTAPLNPNQINKKNESKESKRMMKALAILYNSCQKNLTLHDMWSEKLFGNQRSNIENDSQSSSGNERNQKLDTETKRSEHRSSSIGSISSLGKSKVEDIEWKEVFDTFDHIRFVTFGVIHGLIQRLHEYPIAYGVTTDYDNSTGDDDDDGSASFTTHDELHVNGDKRRSQLGKDVSESKMTNYNYRFSPTIQAQHAPTTPALPSLNLTHLSSTASLTGRNREEIKERNNRKLAFKVASLMNGERCDDELSCIFQRPISELKDLVREKTNKEIISIFQRRKM